MGISYPLQFDFDKLIIDIIKDKAIELIGNYII